MQPSASRLTFNPVFPKRMYSIVVFLSRVGAVPGARDELASTVADHEPPLKHATPSSATGFPDLAELP
jgi:hypothetical protein